MNLKIKIEQNFLELSRKSFRHQKQLLAIAGVLLLAYAICLSTFSDAGEQGVLVVTMFFVPLLFLPQMRNIIRITRYGELLVFDKQKGEFRVNNRRLTRIDDISVIELYHRTGDDIDCTFLGIVYQDGSYYLLDQEKIERNKDLVETGKLIGQFLKVDVVERPHRKKVIL